MRIVLSLFALAALVMAQAPAEKHIDYSVQEKSVQYVVIDLAKEVGLGYDWQKSAAQTDPERRSWVRNLTIKNATFDEAMQKVLGPVELRYQVEGNRVVLYRK